MLKKILTISGHSGLFRLVAEAKNSIIVESIVTGKRMPVYPTTRTSSLADIAVFTQSGEVALKEVFKKIYDKEDGKELEVKNSSEELKAYFGETVPDYDKDRVYVSDIKKILAWYNLLLVNNILNFEEEEQSRNEEKQEEAGNEENQEQSGNEEKPEQSGNEEKQGEAGKQEEISE